MKKCPNCHNKTISFIDMFFKAGMGKILYCKKCGKGWALPKYTYLIFIIPSFVCCFILLLTNVDIYVLSTILVLVAVIVCPTLLYFVKPISKE